MLLLNAEYPEAVLPLPVVFAVSERFPKAEFWPPEILALNET